MVACVYFVVDRAVIGLKVVGTHDMIDAKEESFLII